MNKSLGMLGMVIFCLAGGCAHSSNGPSSSSSVSAGPSRAAGAEWSVKMDNIEACSCPTFCQCYFTMQPALHENGDHPMRFCRFNNAFRITSGHWGSTNLDGMKIWMAGDLGGDFSKTMDWCVVRFEPSATPAQREAGEKIIKAVFPVKWNSFTLGADAKIDWQKTSDTAIARLNDGKSAEIVLEQTRGQDGKPVVIHNVQFWGARSGEFLVMGNKTEAYHDGDKPFEFHVTNGFFNTVTMSSADVKSAHASASLSLKLMQAGAMPGCSDGDCCK